jgi:hypothetical protein
MKRQQSKMILVVGDHGLGGMIEAWRHAETADVTTVVPSSDMIGMIADSPAGLYATACVLPCLEYFDIPWSEHAPRQSVLLPDGTFVRANKAAAAAQSDSAHGSELARLAKRWVARSALSSPRPVLYQAIRNAARFDERQLATMLWEYLSPIVGEVTDINWDDGDICVRTPDGYTCIEFDQGCLIRHSPIGRGPIVSVAHNKIASDFDVLSILDPDSSIAQITFRHGAFVCEAFRDSAPEDVQADLERIFGGGFACLS